MYYQHLGKVVNVEFDRGLPLQQSLYMCDDSRLTEAIEQLASNLYWSGERFAPLSASGEDWSEISNHEREFYRACVRELLRDRRAMTVVLLASETFPTAT